MKIPAETISRAQAGDKDAREEIIAALTPLIRHVAKKHACGSVAVNDLQGESIVAILENLPAYNPEMGNIKSWACGIAKRRCCKLLEVEGRRAAQTNCDLTCLPRPSRDAGGKITLSLLSLLPAGHRALFKRYYSIGREAEDKADIAASLGITQDMLWKRMERIKSELRRRIFSRKADTACQ